MKRENAAGVPEGADAQQHGQPLNAVFGEVA